MTPPPALCEYQSDNTGQYFCTVHQAFDMDLPRCIGCRVRGGLHFPDCTQVRTDAKEADEELEERLSYWDPDIVRAREWHDREEREGTDDRCYICGKSCAWPWMGCARCYEKRHEEKSDEKKTGCLHCGSEQHTIEHCWIYMADHEEESETTSRVKEKEIALSELD